jgi:hypothetical protein
MVIVSLQSSDLRADFLPVVLTSLGVSSNVTGTNSYFFTDLETALQDGTTGDAASQSFSVLAWLIHIK